MCEAWGREKKRMNRINQARGRGAAVPLSPPPRAAGRPGAPEAKFPLDFKPTGAAHRQKNAACASSTRGLLSVVRWLQITTKNNRQRKPPLALAGTREERTP